MAPKSEYPFVNRYIMTKWLPEIEKENVSERAMRLDGFTHVFLFGNPKKQYPGTSHDYYKERDLFLARTIPAYDKNPTYRRFLSLIAWSYMPTKKPLDAPAGSTAA